MLDIEKSYNLCCNLAFFPEKKKSLKWDTHWGEIEMILKINYLLDFIFISMLCFNNFATQVDDTLKVVDKDRFLFMCA